MTQAIAPVRLFWLQSAARHAVTNSPPTFSGDWFKTALVTSALGAAVALMNMWADMREIKTDMNEVKTAGLTHAAQLRDLELRVRALEVRADK
jgi:hypothetical protein